MKALSLVLILLLSGCGLMDKPNNAAAYTSDQILNLGTQVERAQTNGLLSEERGDEYLGLLIQANDLLGGTLSSFAGISECEDSETKFQCIDAILNKVEGAL